MEKKQKNSLAGGIAILAAAACLCYKGLKRVDAKLRKQAERQK